MLKLGQHNTLEILRKTSVGLYLGDQEGNDILLPNKYCSPEMEIGSNIEVFVYKDHEQRWVATTLSPAVKVNEFAYLRVKSISDIGAFLDWGLEKDLFVPFREQNIKMERGQSYVIFLYEDPQTQRLVASAKLNRFFQNDKIDIAPGSLVDLLVFETTPLGFNVIIDQRFKGLIYHADIYQKINIGDQLQGYIKLIREDGGIDISLQAKGLKRLETGAEKIIEHLKQNKGFVNLTDKSSPEEILSKFQMSKKNFKQSVGILFKQRLIRIETDGIYLL
jgi:predicted RNA-binding protein (virulence factor B family)